MPSSAPCLLGDLGRLLPGEDQLDLQLSRLGGAPTWAASPPEHVQERCWKCGCCGSARSFIGQLFASYEEAPGPCRILYLFGCLNRTCSGDERAWKLLRSVGSGPGLQKA
eukprot:TRINITY_DN19627_c0_g1_i3.p2 TRINITY_DN19627_c0_g1~~TRINITY_DN19627_c0_g1_i3.p2  ORF type:complete len:110 (-),score=18.12 TRINITY_DN19627_c0_g1_i3:528-857(-)